MMMQKTGVLPTEYTQIQYIESSGTQYIDTLVSGGNQSTYPEYELTFMPLTSSVGYQQYFAGDRSPRSVPKLYKDLALNIPVRLQSWAGSVNSNIQFNEMATIYATRSATYVNGTDINMPSIDGSNGWGNVTWYLFNSHSESTLASSMRVYKLKMIENGILIRDFIPCIRKSDSKPGMYDTVTKTFYTNAGTGEFIVPA